MSAYLYILMPASHIPASHIECALRANYIAKQNRCSTHLLTYYLANFAAFSDDAIHYGAGGRTTADMGRRTQLLPCNLYPKRRSDRT